tara:strand:- start:25 stop:906 length:882 start_codon:yes stop_codon:yes gene_type:complete
LKKSTELFIGLFATILIVVLYWGVSFLKGENVFSDKRFYYAIYDNVNGLTVSRPVTVNGFKIGQVSNITLNSDNQAYLIVEIALEEEIEFTDQSILEIYDSDIMGSKSLQLKISNQGNVAINGDTLKGTIATGLTSEMSEQFGSVKVGLDQLIISFNKVLKEVEDLSNSANRILLYNEQKVANSIDNVEAISGVIEKQAAHISNTIINISDLSDQLSKIDFITFSNQMTSISQELDNLIAQINKEEGSLGKLLNNDSLYNDLSSTIQSLEQLIDDIKLNPKKYVNISIWGKDK